MVMAKIKWDDEVELNFNDDVIDFEQKKNEKRRKRKWREIEQFKEEQRLSKEMQGYESYEA